MVDPVGAFHRLSGDFPHELAVSVAADENDVVHPEFAGLLHDQRHFLAHVRKNEDIGLFIPDLGELRPEIDILAAAEAQIGDDLSAVFSEALHEELAKPLGVIVSNVIQDRRVEFLDLICREIGDELSLIRIGEADAEGERADRSLLVHCDQRVRGNGADLRHTETIDDRSRGDVDSASVRADDGQDLVLFDHPADRVDCVFGPGPEVVHHEFEILSENAALRVDLVDRKPRRLFLCLSVGGPVTGQRRKIAYFQGIRRKNGSTGNQKQHRNQSAKQELFQRLSPPKK